MAKPKLRNPGPWTFAIFLAACALVALLHHWHVPEAAKMAGELVAAAVLAFGTKSALGTARAQDESPVRSAIREAMKTWPDHEDTPPTKRNGFALKEAIVATGVFVLFLFVVALLSGCSLFESRTPTRAEARSAVLLTAETVRAFDETCARYALAFEDRELALTCAKGYDAARLSLIATGSAVDGWERSETTRDSIVCALNHALGELALGVRALERRGAAFRIYEDANLLVAHLGQCVEVVP